MMRFPRPTLNIDAYLQVIGDLLKDEECHLFIDTNIISQLYKLNDDARQDFYDWISFVRDRFHIPNWVVHEYQKRYTSQHTTDYLSELNNDDIKKRLCNLSDFVKGYISDSLLVGSAYHGNKESLIYDMEDVAKKFSQIQDSISKKLPEHQQRVHQEILNNLQPYVLSTNIYSILESLESYGEIRYSHLVPPGFEDGYKKGNGGNEYGDLVIWHEILDFCKPDVKKAIWITRDAKRDMVYEPKKQTMGGHPVSKGMLSVAHESLVCEFCSKTQSKEFYIINFQTLVQLLANQYPNLALSFQIVTAPILPSDDSSEGDCSTQDLDFSLEGQDQNSEKENELQTLYSDKALADATYSAEMLSQPMRDILEGMRSCNWYMQNDAIKAFRKLKISVFPKTMEVRDMLFVMGRNILQAADGSSIESIKYIRDLKGVMDGWTDEHRISLIDGLLFEVFFNSKGKIRPLDFKASMFKDLCVSINSLSIQDAYKFIYDQLKTKNDGRFVPEVNSDTNYSFKFIFAQADTNDFRTEALLINDVDVSNTFRALIPSIFSDVSNLKTKLSVYYAIPEVRIHIVPFDRDVNVITFICNESTSH